MVRSALLILLVAATIAGCEKSPCWKSIGDATRAVRTVPEFNEIQVEGQLNVILTQDTAISVEVEAGSNLIDFIETEVEGSRLIIRNGNKCDFVRSYNHEINVYVHVDELRKIDFRGAGTLTGLNTIVQPTLGIDLHSAGGSVTLHVACTESHSKVHTGAGDITLSGSTQHHDVYSSSNGVIDCSELEAQTVDATNNGTGDISVFATQLLGVRLTSTGWIKYSGNPTFTYQELTGSGQLIEF